MPTVGQDTHADSALLFGLREVVVDLLYIVGVGVESAGGADPALELDEGVESGKVHGAARSLGGRVLLDDLAGSGQSGGDQKVANRAGDVRFGFRVVVPPEYLGGGLGVTGVVVVDVDGHSIFYYTGMDTHRSLSTTGDRLRRLPGLYSLHDFFTGLDFCHAQLERFLEVQPQLGRRAEVAGQAQGSVGGHSPLAFQDRSDPVGGDVQRFC